MAKTLLTGLSAALAALFLAGAASAFDSGRPSDVMSVAQAAGATVVMKADAHGNPWIDTTVGGRHFEIDFYHCNDAKTHCSVVLYAIGFDTTTVTLDQINRWNRWAELCPGFLDTGNTPRAWYPIKPLPGDGPADVAAQFGSWQQCLGDFSRFASNPDTFLSSVE